MPTWFIVLIVIALLCGGFGQSRVGYAGWSPLGLLLLVVLIMWATGHLRL